MQYVPALYEKKENINKYDINKIQCIISKATDKREQKKLRMIKKRFYGIYTKNRIKL